MMTTSITNSSVPETIPLPCTCANLRRASRIVTQLYDDELRPSGLRATQFTLLQALDRMKNVSQGVLADVLGLDSTTLTRTLALLRRKGWIHAKRGEDRREVQLALTAEGMREYQLARPYWLLAQKKLQRALGDADWKRLVTATIQTAALARKA